MGKPKKVEVDDDDAVFAQRAIELKDEAAKLFAARDFKKAAAAYEQGIALMAPNDPDAAALHCNRAACFLHMRQYADVVAESTRALKISPKYTKALVYRGRAYNATGQTKKAKADSAAAIACDASSEEAKAFAADLEPKKQVQGLGGLGLAPAKKGEKRSKEEIAAAEALKQRELARQAQMMRERERQRQWGPPVTVKARCGEDVRTMIVPSMIAHKDLMTALQRKFPDLSAFTVRYTDASGTLQPLNGRADFAAALAVANAAAEDASKPTLLGIPSVKLTLSELERLGAAEEETAADADGETEKAEKPALRSNEVVEVDEWILDFAALFREHLGIDAEAHLDFHAQGLEICNAALEADVSVEKAEEMLEEAKTNFQSAAALAMFNWGNVYMCQARKAMDGGRDPPVEEGGPPGAAIATASAFDEAKARLDTAKGRYEEALRFKPDFHDASIAIVQRRYEMSRLLSAAAGLGGEAAPAGQDVATRAKEAEDEFNAACAEFQKMYDELPPEEEKKEKEVKEGEEQAEEPPSVRQQILVMWGNTLFEHSQMAAKQSKPFQPLLDEAIAKFNEAGCQKSDVDQALKVHRGLRTDLK